jgi:hypothetical protein
MGTVENTTIDSEHLAGITDDTSIYRYISIEEFISIIESREIALMQIAHQWESNEAKKAKHTIQALEKYSENNEFDEDNKKKLIEFAESIKAHLEKMYGSSWTRNDNSDALWKIYSESGTGVLVKTNIQKLKDSLSKIENPNVMYAVGKIIYKDNISLESILQEKKFYFGFEHFLIKKKAFVHEDEIRAIILPRPESNEKISGFNENCIKAPIPDDFIEEIIIDPRAEDWYVDSIKSLIKSKKWLGNIPVKKSDLHKPIEY